MRCVAYFLVFLALGGCQTTRPPGDVLFHPAGQKALHATQLTESDLVVTGETYVPVYSNIYWGQSTSVTELSATVSVRNADVKRPLILTHVDYYDSRGKLIRQYLDAPTELEPMGTVEWVIEVHDTEGGSGANFMVGWGAPQPIARPVMESIMMGQISSFAISFVSEGRPVEIVEPEREAPEPRP